MNIINTIKSNHYNTIKPVNNQLNNQSPFEGQPVEQTQDGFNKTVNSARTIFEQLLLKPDLFETVQLSPRAFPSTCASLKFMNPLNVFGLSTVLFSAQHQ